jgi:hypothetical protein
MSRAGDPNFSEVWLIKLVGHGIGKVVLVRWVPGQILEPGARAIERTGRDALADARLDGYSHSDCADNRQTKAAQTRTARFPIRRFGARV